MIKWLIDWWNNNKNVLENLILPKLDLCIVPLTDLMISKGVPAAIASTVAVEVVQWLKEYLKRQL